MDDLKNTSLLVKKILELHPEVRNSDNRLYDKVILQFDFEHGTDLHLMPAGQFFNTMHIYGCPKFETVRRARQKIQAAFPELRADKPVEEARADLQKEFRRYAISETA